jgi:hypothetical protein
MRMGARHQRQLDQSGIRRTEMTCGLQLHPPGSPTHPCMAHRGNRPIGRVSRFATIVRQQSRPGDRWRLLVLVRRKAQPRNQSVLTTNVH